MVDRKLQRTWKVTKRVQKQIADSKPVQNQSAGRQLRDFLARRCGQEREELEQGHETGRYDHYRQRRVALLALLPLPAQTKGAGRIGCS